MPVRLMIGRSLTWWQKIGVAMMLLATAILGLFFFAVLLGLFATLAIVGSVWMFWRRRRLRSNKVRKDGTLRAEYRIIHEEEPDQR